MRYRVVAVGRTSRGPFRDAVADYLRRLRALAGETELVEVKESRSRDAQERRREESEALLASAAGRVVALDERGREWTTPELAAHVAALEVAGTSRLTLLVGGAEGTTDALRARADETWALSRLTLAHELALTVLLEGLYRVESLRAGHPYHRG